MIEAVDSNRMSVYFYSYTWRHIGYVESFTMIITVARNWFHTKVGVIFKIFIYS